MNSITENTIKTIIDAASIKFASVISMYQSFDASLINTHAVLNTTPNKDKKNKKYKNMYYCTLYSFSLTYKINPHQQYLRLS